jgi:hypothetical protein
MLLLNALLFASVGVLLGGVLFLGMLAIEISDPRAALVFLWIPVEAMSGALYLGGAPAVVTGLVAAFLRTSVRPLPILAMLMAPIGAGITAIYVTLIGVRSSGYPLISMLSLVGGVAAFCCSFVLWCYRPWLVTTR